MRHPITHKQSNMMVNPYKFARERRLLELCIPLQDTKELQAWQGDNQAMNASLEGYVDTYQQAHLKGKVVVQLQLECQRCLEPMNCAIDHPFDYVLIAKESEEDTIEGGFEALICEQELDLAWFFEEEVLLAMPMIARHTDCALPVQGLEADEASDSSHRPFAGLKDMMLFKE